MADAAAKALLTSSYPGVQVYVLRPWNTAEWYLMQWRHFVYAQYLSSRAHLAPRGVLLSDARDVAFNAPLWQRQPVQEQLAAGNVVFALEVGLVRASARWWSAARGQGSGLVWA